MATLTSSTVLDAAFPTRSQFCAPRTSTSRPLRKIQENSRVSSIVYGYSSECISINITTNDCCNCQLLGIYTPNTRIVINCAIFVLCPRLQCPILEPGEKWVDLSTKRKAELREEHGMTEEDEFWREEVEGARPTTPSQIFVDGESLPHQPLHKSVFKITRPDTWLP